VHSIESGLFGYLVGVGGAAASESTAAGQPFIRAFGLGLATDRPVNLFPAGATNSGGERG
jgi:hypothetical protein